MAYFWGKVSSLALQHLTNIYLLSIYDMRDSTVGVGNMVVKKLDELLFLQNLRRVVI